MSKIIHNTRDFYICEVTKWVYQWIWADRTTVKFVCIVGLNKGSVIRKYKKDIIKENR